MIRKGLVFDPMFQYKTLAKAGDAGGAGEGAGDDAGEGEGAGDGGGEGGGKDPNYIELKERYVALEKKSKELESEAASRRKQLSPYRDKNGQLISADEFHKFQQEKAAEEQRKMEERGEFEKLRQADRDAIAAKDQKLKEIQESWDREKISRALISAASALDALPQTVESGEEGEEPQIVSLFSGQFKTGEDGKVVHVRKLGKDGQPMSAREFLEERKAGAGANLFRAALRSGSGEGAGVSEDATGKVKIKRSLPNVERQAAWNKAVAAGKQPVLVD